jgi:DNA-binding MarR family transcriptional regulator/N-acetylglutamate synthase-like GNAT family acetyltransferase
VNLDQRIHAVRRFNRFYTRQIGVLNEGLSGSPFPLTEARVLYELAHVPDPVSASDLGRALDLDPGYLSRILRGFEARGLVRKTRSRSDGRRSHLELTPQGRRAFAPLNARSHEETRKMLDALTPGEQERLAGAMRTIETLLARRNASAEPFLLRHHHAGDMGWVVSRHGALYAQEYGWDMRFEALVAQIVARFVEEFDPTRERCWIAEGAGGNVGSVFLVKKSKTTAQLRLLLVEPGARGLGIGERLVTECLRFARDAGYRKVELWTNSVLLTARRIYAKLGFRITHTERHRSFGHDLVGETWEINL